MKSLRILKALFIALLKIACCIIILFVPEIGIDMVILMLGVVLLLYGLRKVFYFFSMGIHMIGGKIILYEGIIFVDIGLFTLTLNSLPKQMVMIYLLLYYVIEGAIETFRAVESRKVESKYWKGKLVNGILYFADAITCLVYINSFEMMSIILCVGIIYSAIAQVVLAFRRETFVYIQ